MSANGQWPLSPVQISGVFAVELKQPPMVLLRIPKNAHGPASLTIRNLDAAAVLSLKWLHDSIGGGGVGALEAIACPIRLDPGGAFSWDPPPCGSVLVVITSINSSLCGVDGSWTVPK